MHNQISCESGLRNENTSEYFSFGRLIMMLMPVSMNGFVKSITRSLK